MSVLSYVNASDFRVSGRLLDWAPPRWFRVFMIVASRLGDGWLWLLAAAVLAARGDGESHRVLLAVALTAGLANLLLVALKGRVRRPRPCDVRRPRHFDVAPLLCIPSDRYSFPSGHSLNAFALAIVIALAFPALAAPAFVVAASVASSRVVLGLHFPSDVIAGSVLGVLVGGSVFFSLLG